MASTIYAAKITSNLRDIVMKKLRLENALRGQTRSVSLKQIIRNSN